MLLNVYFPTVEIGAEALSKSERVVIPSSSYISGVLSLTSGDASVSVRRCRLDFGHDKISSSVLRITSHGLGRSWAESKIPYNYLMLSTTSYVGMGEVVSKEAFDWVSNDPLIVQASSVICRLMDDMAGHKFEQKRSHVDSVVECYMKQYGASEEEVLVELHKQDQEKKPQLLSRPNRIEGAVGLLWAHHVARIDDSNRQCVELVEYFILVKNLVDRISIDT
ncbi:hypothetical protein ACSBR2_017024 [Camellia fascicularis]